MTELELRQKLVKTAQAYLGCKESDGSHRVIIDIYNSHKPLARGYAVTYTDAWCSTFVSAMSILCGMTEILPTECGCGKHIDLFKSIDSWVEADNYVPKIGDVIFYNWNDSGVGECTTGASHVGIVTSCDGRTITIIEGNISNAVGYRTLSVNGRYIRGFGVPKYELLAEAENAVAADEVRYQKLEELPAWAVPEATELVELGALKGNEKGLDVTEDMLRTMIINLRATKALLFGNA
ncbi:MAG: CHAP domain-containing protein [Oscillospiraceae bacterium]|nr:CHAP domain-containing protein [Oscillospiraceae bacterium]